MWIGPEFGEKQGRRKISLHRLGLKHRLALVCVSWESFFGLCRLLLLWAHLFVLHDLDEMMMLSINVVFKKGCSCISSINSHCIATIMSSQVRSCLNARNQSGTESNIKLASSFDISAFDGSTQGLGSLSPSILGVQSPCGIWEAAEG